jgi:UDPglucose--hexose-1-phosphate uridylyltransferase
VPGPLDLTDHPHRRYNPLTREWVLVSPHRTRRPWLGQVEKPPPDERPRYDPNCYLCPGNERAGGARNPHYTKTFVFENDFAALRPQTGPAEATIPVTSSDEPLHAGDESPLDITQDDSRGRPFDVAQDRPSETTQDGPFDTAQDRHLDATQDSPGSASPRRATTLPTDRRPLLHARAERGICRVICFSPRHDLTLPEMDLEDIRRVVDVWGAQYQELGALPQINHVQVFENKGSMMGASNPHPHGQVWANESLPNEPTRELIAQTEYLQERGSCLLCDYLALEERLAQRLVCRNEHFVALVPFWAVWPFETLLLSHRHVSSLSELTDAERDGLAEILQRLLTRYDNLFEVSFPYSMGFHQQPTDGRKHAGWHLHAHTYPPLLRSATVRKFMVGYEMLAEPQRDVPAEAAAARLREASEVHYRQRP